MAAEAVLGATIQVALQIPLKKAISLAAEQLGFVRNFQKDLLSLRQYLEMLEAFCRDVERRPVVDEAVKVWVGRLEVVAYDADYLLDEISYEVLRRKVEIQNRMKRKLCFPVTLSDPITFHWKMGRKIRDIIDKLKEINEEANSLGLQYSRLGAPGDIIASASTDRETDAYSLDPNVFGRENEASLLVEKMINSKNESCLVIPIVGLGGIGKTTMAQLIFNDKLLDGCFDRKFWVCVSDNFDSKRIFESMLEQLGHNAKLNTRQAIVQTLQEKLRGKRCLLVLDDVWYDKPRSNEFMNWDDKWINFRASFDSISTVNGTCILVTTRNQEVSSIVSSQNSMSLQKLSDDECWQILRAKSFAGNDVPPEFIEIGMGIARKCHGLPLAAKVLGGMLRGTDIARWRSILEKELSYIDGGDQNGILKILRLSYDHLL